jgi:long-chain acyl-CoA synthetase
MAGPATKWRAALADLPPAARVVIRCASGQILADIIGGCLDHDLVAVPLEPRTSDRRLASLAGRVAASLVIDGPDSLMTVTPGAGPAGHPQAAGLAFIIFTSGSTGEPKGVMLGRGSVAGNAAKTARLLGFARGSGHATCLPLYHVNALVMSLVGTRMTGARLSICERFQPDRYFQQIRESGARTASVVPALLHAIVGARPPWPESLDFLITAAAPLSSRLADQFYRAYGPGLRQGYGLSEAVNFSFMMPALDRDDFREQYIRNVPAVGLPLPETRFRLEDGEIFLHSPDVMAGYWEDPAATAQTLGADGWLRTGDLGELRDGFLVLRGRRQEIINCGGEKCYPLDVEQQWRAAGMTGGFAAVPIPVADLGHDVGLVAESDGLASVRRFHAARVPQPIAARTDGFLVTATGKPRRAEMGRRLAGRRESADRYEELLGYAVRCAATLVASEHRPVTARAGRLRAQALALARLAGRPDVAGSAGRRSAAHDALDALVDYWPALAGSGSDGDGEAMMRRHPGLWRRLMVEWPMGSYARLVTEVLRVNDWLTGHVLEVGSGVGNTTSLIAPLVRGDFVWSDASADLVSRGGWPGRGVVYDFDREPPAGLDGFTTIVATNAVHCAADKLWTLRHLHSMLAAGGVLVLAEGASPTTPSGTPWALDYLFCAFDGWWNRSGFLTRWEWLTLLADAGFRRPGYGVLRAGGHDLGGVVWAARDDA